MESEDVLEGSGAESLIRRRGLTIQVDLKAIRHKMAEIGHVKTVLLGSACTCLASIIITAVLWTVVFDRPLEYAPLVIAFTVPAILCPIGMWFLVGITLDLHHLESEMRHLASYDVLTDIMTRRAFLSSTERLHALMYRHKKPFSLAYIDLDNFKLINDNFGHTSGDEVLRAFSDVLRSVVRRSDLVGRIGGEEFALALPETDMTGAMHILNQIRVLAKNTRVEIGDQVIQFTVSIGVACCDAEYFLSLDDMIRQADQALYAAKDAGKDCVIKHQQVVKTKSFFGELDR